MRQICFVLVILCVSIATLPEVSGAAQRLGLEAGYITTSASKYGQGLVYGASILEGTGRFGFGIALLKFANSISYEKAIKDGSETITYRYEEKFTDFYVTILATYRRENARKTIRLLVGTGPQVHFLQADKNYVLEGYTDTARDSRLGWGVVARFEKVIPAFGQTRAFLSSTYSWMESGAPSDVYTPPIGGMESATITAGLAFPF